MALIHIILLSIAVMLSILYSFELEFDFKNLKKNDVCKWL